jgi:hypothetical protein
MAIKCGQTGTAICLLSQGLVMTDNQELPTTGRNVLINAAESGSVDMIELLLEHEVCAGWPLSGPGLPIQRPMPTRVRTKAWFHAFLHKSRFNKCHNTFGPQQCVLEAEFLLTSRLRRESPYRAGPTPEVDLKPRTRLISAQRNIRRASAATNNPMAFALQSLEA